MLTLALQVECIAANIDFSSSKSVPVGQDHCRPEFTSQNNPPQFVMQYASWYVLQLSQVMLHSILR